jgi:hypothetical protein
MASSQIRLSTLAEIKVLSIETVRGQGNTTTSGASSGLTEFKAKLGDATKNKITRNDITKIESLFKTVGIARQIRIDEQYNTQNIYAVGSPTRPRIVPGNMSVGVTCERLQLDKRNLYDFMATPEYFYSPDAQRITGILDAVYYTYMFVRSKEPKTGTTGHPAFEHDIYALMPVSSSRTITNGDVMVSHNVQLTGFKLNNGDNTLQSLLDTLTDDITEDFVIPPATPIPPEL